MGPVAVGVARHEASISVLSVNQLQVDDASEEAATPSSGSKQDIVQRSLLLSGPGSAEVVTFGDKSTSGRNTALLFMWPGKLQGHSAEWLKDGPDKGLRVYF